MNTESTLNGSLPLKPFAERIIHGQSILLSPTSMNRLIARGLSAALLFSALAPAAMAEPESFPTKPFTDVKEGSTFYEAVEYLRQGNVLTGYEDGTFRPNNRLNRAEFVKLIANPFILKNSRVTECLNENVAEMDDTVFFPDVKKDAWYAASVCVTKEAEIIDGYPDGTFKPNQTINVAEAMKMLAGTFAFQTANEEQGEQWYMPYARALAERNAIPPTIDNFAQPITRGEMAEMLFRLKSQNSGKSSRSLSTISAY